MATNRFNILRGIPVSVNQGPRPNSRGTTKPSSRHVTSPHTDPNHLDWARHSRPSAQTRTQLLQRSMRAAMGSLGRGC
jgi:hypothetical protein